MVGYNNSAFSGRLESSHSLSEVAPQRQDATPHHWVRASLASALQKIYLSGFPSAARMAMMCLLPTRSLSV